MTCPTISLSSFILPVERRFEGACAEGDGTEAVEISSLDRKVPERAKIQWAPLVCPTPAFAGETKSEGSMGRLVSGIPNFLLNLAVR